MRLRLYQAKLAHHDIGCSPQTDVIYVAQILVDSYCIRLGNTPDTIPWILRIAGERLAKNRFRECNVFSSVPSKDPDILLVIGR